MNAVDHVLMKIPKRRFQMRGSGHLFSTLHTCSPQSHPIAFPIAAQFGTFKNLDFNSRVIANTWTYDSSSRFQMFVFVIEAHLQNVVPHMLRLVQQVH